MEAFNAAFCRTVEKELAEGVFDEVVAMRRYIHAHPGVGTDTGETEAYVREKLTEYGVTVLPARTGVLAVISGRSHEKMAALRADMDALPLREENDVPYRSLYEGKMHACGHDAHTAMLLGAAKILSGHREELPCDVLLIFQPSEEGPTVNGALEMLKETDRLGLTEKICVIFGQHVFNNAPTGRVGTRMGALAASADTFMIRFIGCGGHCSEPHLNVDALSLGVRFVDAMESFMSRRVDPLDSAVCAIGSFHAGTSHNIVPETAELSGSIRCQREETRELIKTHLRRIAEGVCHGWDADFELKFMPGLPVLVNDGAAAAYALSVARQTVGRDYYDIPTPMMYAEDFCFYAQRIPACFLNLGTRNEEKGFVEKNHSPRFDIDEAAFTAGVKMLCSLAANVPEEMRHG